MKSEVLKNVYIIEVQDNDDIGNQLPLSFCIDKATAIKSCRLLNKEEKRIRIKGMRCIYTFSKLPRSSSELIEIAKESYNVK